jgi:hypothetical protein
MSELARTLSNRRRQSEIARFLQNTPSFSAPTGLPQSIREQLERLQVAEAKLPQPGSNPR